MNKGCNSTHLTISLNKELREKVFILSIYNGLSPSTVCKMIIKAYFDEGEPEFTKPSVLAT